MNKSHNRGIYTDLITQYIAYKRSLGFKMDDTDERLRRFDRLTIERGENSIGISKELFDAWITIGSIESDYNRCHRICILKGFSIYLQQLGYESYIPKLNKCRSNYIPYIYTKAEINAILHECDKLILKKSNIPSCKFAMPALIRMLYGTGIRVGEAIKLTHRDVDLNTGVLILRECKNGQDRLVPMSLSLREVCKDYIANKQMVGLSVEDDDVFDELLNLTKLIEKYQFKVKKIQVDEKTMDLTIYIRRLSVELGRGDQLAEKMSDLADMLPVIRKKRGKLDMSQYMEDGNYSFKETE